MNKETTCKHSFVDADNEGVYGLEICRFCGLKQKRGKETKCEGVDCENCEFGCA